MVFEKSAGAIIFYRENGEIYFLLLEYPTYWGFVRGKIEKNENVLHTIQREAKEEANVKEMKILEGFRHVQNWYYTRDKKIIKRQAIFYVAEISEEQAGRVRISSEHKAFEFCNLGQALGMMRVKDERLMLKKAHDFIMGKG